MKKEHFCAPFSYKSANYSAPTSAFTTSTMRCTYASQTSCVGASAITRISGSVPDGRTRIRPSPFISSSTTRIISLIFSFSNANFYLLHERLLAIVGISSFLLQAQIMAFRHFHDVYKLKCT